MVMVVNGSLQSAKQDAFHAVYALVELFRAELSPKLACRTYVAKHMPSDSSPTCVSQSAHNATIIQHNTIQHNIM